MYVSVACFQILFYRAAHGKALVLPQEVRWNTLLDSIESYLENWPILIRVCEEHRDIIDRDIANKIKDFAIKQNAENYKDLLKPIAVALDRMQRDGCTLSDAVIVWTDLYQDLKDAKQSKDV